MAAFGALAGLACLIYYLVIVLHAGLGADFAWIWLAGTVFFGGLAVLTRLGLLSLWLRRGIIVLLALGLAFFGLVCARIVGGMLQKGRPGLDYVVVLGAQVKGKRPSLALTRRLGKALEYAQENPGTTLILSGGQGTGEEISEARCMQQWLLDQGLPGERMVLEDRSTTTRENLLYSHQMTGCGDGPVGIISNNFHIYRAVRLARALGYEQPLGIAAPSDPLMQVHYMVREVFALVKEHLTGNL